MCSSLIFLKASSIWKSLTLLLTFYLSIKEVLNVFLSFFLCFLYYVVCSVRFEGFFRFLFLILDVSNLQRSGACFIPSPISFFSNFWAWCFWASTYSFLNKFFAPSFVPNLASSPSILPPFSAFLVRLFLGSNGLVRFIVTFCGKFRLVALS